MPLALIEGFDPSARHLPMMLAFFAAAVASIVLTPLTARLAIKLGAIDSPDDERRVHDLPTPRLGGLAMMLSVTAAALLLIDWRGGTLYALQLTDQMRATLIGAIAVTIIGAVDDVRGLSWKPKLLGQVLIAMVVVLAPIASPAVDTLPELALTINRIDPPFLAAFNVPELIGVAIPIIWIVALMNVINFIDGVDGLAAGTCAISTATFALLAASYNRINVAILAAATCGAALGFLRDNFQRDRARVFMGDSGSMLLGYLLAVIAVQGVLKTAAAVALVIPLALLLAPILDTTFVVAKRLKHNRAITRADRWHLHHRLLNVGYTPRRVAAMFWLWTASMSAVALALRFVDFQDVNPRTGEQIYHLDGLVVLGLISLVALGLSLYMVTALEIIKLKRVRERNAEFARRAREN